MSTTADDFEIASDSAVRFRLRKSLRCAAAAAVTRALANNLGAPIPVGMLATEADVSTSTARLYASRLTQLGYATHTYLPGPSNPSAWQLTPGGFAYARGITS